ncbi:MAG: RNA-splicing ligase RtcB [Bacteroidetes bacterium]|nr:MAG: RNA-splicing ligase RtcB [Bacteroidota bacterium]
MANFKLKGKQLRALGYPQSPVISVAMNIMERNYKHSTEEEVISILKAILANPEEYKNDPVLGAIAFKLLPKVKPNELIIDLDPSGIPYNVFGREFIEEGAITQMETASRLPIAVAGALMPDAHSGYGLPIGGVFATENAVIPYGVGVDIGCRMCLSIFDIDPKDIIKKEQFFARELNEATVFGSGGQLEDPVDHEILERAEFNSTPLLKGLQGKAWKQLGTSGSGNHFVEFGIVEISAGDPILKVDAGSYLALLSHSGSRGLGANIANHFTKLAMEKRKLPSEAAHLAWLGLDEEEGIEYWIAMNLAGDYASACHHVIHEKIEKQLGRKNIARVENHHNFAWKEILEGKEVIVHRKGATPAGKNVLGIIPGSMTAPGFIVKGLGQEASLFSASHGAGRKMSRTAALKSISHEWLQENLAKHGVKLLGGGLDEAPHAYKDIELVMKSQKHLVETIGKFYPRIVKMDGGKVGRRKSEG